MVYNKDKNLKLYYSISEVAEHFGVAETLLRFWEKEFPQQIAPKKAGRNIRQYTKEDIEQIQLVYNLVKVRGLKISAARELLKKNKEGVEQRMEALELLKSIKQQLLDIRESYRLDEFDPTDDTRLDQEAMESHPTYRNIKGELYKIEELEQMFGHDRTMLDAAIKMYEKESALYHASYDAPNNFYYWLEYEKGVAANLTKIEEMQKGGKK
jgi:DNA-binding transcriptional MerR regulator